MTKNDAEWKVSGGLCFGMTASVFEGALVTSYMLGRSHLYIFLFVSFPI
jgi:hypothetical protein